ncbi:hypothetical protein KX816_15490 [Sphingosinicellaceae bacterium]|nr:hypothetical protein KX816_15490 [Sphingosinicellaceae bacterium]
MSLFKSFFLGGFECSTQKRADGIRLDLIALSGHDVQADGDYRLLAAHGIHAARDGVRWHLVERRRGQYDWSSLLPQLRAARAARADVVWDLFHYGWPNGADIWSPGFIQRFAEFCGAAAAVIRDESDGPLWFCPVNEISFHSWGGGDVGYLNPFARGRGGELKAQLVRMYLAAVDAVRAVAPNARFMSAEPLINIIPQSPLEQHVRVAADHREGQHEAVDMLIGRKRPELGGRPGTVDAIGVNYYFNNQWIDNGRHVFLGDVLFKPLREMLADVHARYALPVVIAETGTEGVFRAPWLHYIADEAASAMVSGVPVEGICLYPVLSHRGWDNDRHCPNGLFAGFTPDADRTAYKPLADELARQQDLFARGVLARD